MAPSFVIRADESSASGASSTSVSGNESDFTFGPTLTPEQLAALPHDSRGPELNAVLWSLTGVSAVFLGLRLYCKLKRGKGPWWDDWFLVAAWVAIAIHCCIMSYIISLGYGEQTYDVKPENIIPIFRDLGVAGTFAIIGSIWSKTSFALTILRLSGGTWMRPTIWFIIISMNIFMGLAALFNWIHCWPVESAWDLTVKGSCWPRGGLEGYNTFSAAYSGAMDVILALLPWKIIWGLQMKRKEKIGVAVAMSMGIFAGITSFIKTSKIWVIENVSRDGAVELSIWTIAESTTTIIAASIPVLRVLVHEVGQTVAQRYGLTSRSRGGTGGDGATHGNSRVGGGIFGSTAAGKHDASMTSTTDGGTKPIRPGARVVVTSEGGNIHHLEEKASFGDGSSDGDNSGTAVASNPGSMSHKNGSSLKILRTNEVALEYSERRDDGKGNGSWLR